jgi:hypothetical protein
MKPTLLLIIGLIATTACGPVADPKAERDPTATDSVARRDLPTSDLVRRPSPADWGIRDDLPLSDPGAVPNALCADLYAVTFHPNQSHSESTVEAFKHDTALDIMRYRYYVADHLPGCLAETQSVLEPYLGRDAVEVVPFPEVATLPAAPSFADYNAELYSGPIATPTAEVLPSGYEQFLQQLQQSIAAGPNFGGRYFVLEVSCGEECRSALIYDMRSGLTRSYPFELGRNARFLFRRESRLLGAIWDEESDGRPYCGVRYLDFGGSVVSGEGFSGRVPGRCPPLE